MHDEEGTSSLEDGLHRASTATPQSNVTHHVLAYQEINSLPYLGSFSLPVVGCPWIQVPKTSLASAPCCLQFARSDTGIGRSAMDLPIKDNILELF
ncbi:hypothetical protein T4E_6415 [Trichinella pseudospiralis]|uniref:Uncharacterized protein n=1 Tax=Trichinella pseudospiralis TaxID=6337 RepID=A0A0V0XSR9_TRIPS|nr:hypothetical protein T4E_6415 [Trichinella pseudospiralis]